MFIVIHRIQGQKLQSTVSTVNFQQSIANSLKLKKNAIDADIVPYPKVSNAMFGDFKTAVPTVFLLGGTGINHTGRYNRFHAKPAEMALNCSSSEDCCVEIPYCPWTDWVVHIFIL